MTIEEMKKELISNGYLVKRADETSGIKISRNIVRIIGKYVQEKYGWEIYFEKIHKGSRYNNSYSDIESAMMQYLKQKIFDTWNLKTYISIPDIDLVISWGKEWIDNLIESHEEWFEENEERRKNEELEKLKSKRNEIPKFYITFAEFIRLWKKKRLNNKLNIVVSDYMDE